MNPILSAEYYRIYWVKDSDRLLVQDSNDQWSQDCLSQWERDIEISMETLLTKTCTLLRGPDPKAIPIEALEQEKVFLGVYSFDDEVFTITQPAIVDDWIKRNLEPRRRPTIIEPEPDWEALKAVHEKAKLELQSILFLDLTEITLSTVLEYVEILKGVFVARIPPHMLQESVIDLFGPTEAIINKKYTLYVSFYLRLMQKGQSFKEDTFLEAIDLVAAGIYDMQIYAKIQLRLAKRKRSKQEDPEICAAYFKRRNFYDPNLPCDANDEDQNLKVGC